VVNRQVDNHDIIAIEPASRSMAYVPYYDPGVVYGAWPYPAYPPYYWPGYYYGPDPLVAGLTFAAFAVGAWAIADNWWGGGFDWGRRDIFWRDGRNRHRFAHNPDRRGGNQFARNRDNRRNAVLNDRNNRRDRQANVNNRRNTKVSQNRASNRQVKRASASQRRIAHRSSVNRNLARANRGNAMHFSHQRARASFAGPRGGGGRHFGGGRMGGGGGHSARGGGRRGR
jgi:hypothetical protein